MKHPFLLFITLISLDSIAQIVNSEILDANNVSAYIHDEGGFFNRPSQGLAGYEVPKGGGVSSFFAGSYWIGALDPFGNVKLTGNLYGTGSNSHGFHSGPIAESIAYGSIGYNNEYQQAIWRVSKAEIIQHINNYNSPTYIIPTSISSWPGNGDVNLGVASQLAPFVDLNDNGLYEPSLGDYPDIRGNEAVYVIMNDESYQPDGNQLGIEVHAMFYQEVSGSYTNNATMLNLKVLNRSNVNYSNYRQGLFLDTDLGNYSDDYIGCFPDNHVGFVYNGDDNDESDGGLQGYGANPPCQGVVVLSHEMDGFCTFGSLNFSSMDTTLWLLMNSQWNDSTSWVNPITGNQTNFILSGNPNTPGAWHEAAVNNPSGDRRMLITIAEPFFPAGGSICTDYAFIYDRLGQNRLENVQRVIDQAASWRNAYASGNNFPCQSEAFNALNENVGAPTFSIYPNPSNGIFTVSLASSAQDVIMQLFTADGKIIHEKRLSGTTIDIDDSLEDGIYFVRISSENTHAIERLIINH
jgi:hypothetical protein